MMALPALITILALIAYLLMTFQVGRMRMKHDVQAPSVDGPPEFLRAFRVQQNMLEQLIIFLPALWIFALTLSDMVAALLGLVWILARVIYALSYYKQAEKRMVGFVIGLAMSAILVVGGLVGSLLLLSASL